MTGSIKIFGSILAFILVCSGSKGLFAQEAYNGIYKVSDAGKLFTVYNDTVQLHIDPIPLIDIEEFESVKKKKNNDIYEYELLITLTESGTEKFAKVSKANIGKQLAVIIDNKLLTAPVVMTEITGGKLSVTGIDKETVKRIEKDFKKR